MSQPAIHALMASATMTFALECAVRLLHGGRRDSTGGIAPAMPTPTAGIGMALGIGAMMLVGEQGYPPMNPVPAKVLPMVMVALVAVMLAGLQTDFSRRPSTRRHGIGLVVAGLLLFMGGLTVPGLWSPGNVLLITVASSLIFTLLWVLLMASIIEICALVPFVAGFVVLATGGLTLTVGTAWANWPGYVVAGTMMGAVIGRWLADLVLANSRRMEKGEVLALGVAASAATLAVYTKKIALGGLIIPLGFLLVLFALLLVQSLDRSLMLRPTPRE